MISLTFLVCVLWFAFSVKLGGRTFADHVDRISETPEAHDLIEGTRATVNPVLHEATDRMLGEHIEAPIRAQPSATVEPGNESATPKKRTAASTPEHVKLPGRT